MLLALLSVAYGTGMKAIGWTMEAGWQNMPGLLVRVKCFVSAGIFCPVSRDRDKVAHTGHKAWETFSSTWIFLELKKVVADVWKLLNSLRGL